MFDASDEVYADVVLRRLSAALFFFAPSALAEPAHHVILKWSSSDGCVDEPTISKTVEDTLGRAVFRSTEKPAAIVDGEIGPREGGGFHASISLLSVDGGVLTKREIETEAPTCDRLDESAAIVIALMVDGVTEPKQVAPPPAPRPPLKIAPSLPRPTETRIEVALGNALAFGLLPNVSVGGFVRAGVLREAWSVKLDASLFSPSDAAQDGVAARIWAFATELDGCYAPIRERVRWDICAVAARSPMRSSTDSKAFRSSFSRVRRSSGASISGRGSTLFAFRA